MATDRKITLTNDSGKVIIVVLDMNAWISAPADIAAFVELPSKNKVDLLYQNIEKICAQLKTTSPEAMWIFCWKEYGITEMRSRFVTLEALGYLKASMLNLTKKYEQLLVISGTVAVRRHFSFLDYVEKRPKFLAEYKSRPNLNSNEIERHRAKHESVNDSGRAKGIDVVSNTAHIFQGETIQRRRKIAPDNETAEYLASTYIPHLPTHDLSNTVYRTASSRTSHPIITVIHPVTKKAIRIGIEICAEHAHGILKETGMPKPLIHCILSDSINLYPDYLHGEVIVQCDSRIKPKHILGQESIPNIEIFQVDLLKDLASKKLSSTPSHITSFFAAPGETKEKKEDAILLQGPLQPFYPLEIHIVTILEEALAQLPPGERAHVNVKNLRDAFTDNLYKEIECKTTDAVSFAERQWRKTFYESFAMGMSRMDLGEEGGPLYKKALKDIHELLKQYPHTLALNSFLDSPVVAERPAPLSKKSP